jgi:hypothetical protein
VMYEGDEALPLLSIRLVYPVDNEPRPVLTRYVVRVYFRLWGVLGREHYVVEAFDEEMAEACGWAALEDALIAEGAPTFECGCCVDGGQTDIMPVDAFAAPLGPALEFWVNESKSGSV